MSSKVAILEGDKSRKFSKVEFLRTKKTGGGYAFWVSEKDRQTTTKSINENGTYKASDEKDSSGKKYYGFSQVTVNVPNASKAVGKKEDGNTHVVQPDINGDLTDKIIPDSIKITTNPSTMTYEDGDTISKDGMVVKAYQGDGSLWEASGYSGGIIPNSELNLDPSTAHYSGGGGGDVIYSKDGVHALAVKCTVEVSGRYWRNYRTATPTGYREIGSFGRHHAFITADTSAEILFMTLYNGKIYVADSAGNRTTSVIAYEDGTSAQGNESVGATTTPYVFVESVPSADAFSFLTIPTSTVDPTTVDFTGATPDIDNTQTITVKWDRPEDGKTLTDTFTIEVVPLR